MISVKLFPKDFTIRKSRWALVRDCVSVKPLEWNGYELVVNTIDALSFLPDTVLSRMDLPAETTVFLDTAGQMAFGHWFFESAILIPSILDDFHPFCPKFLITEKKSYKEKILRFLNVEYSYMSEICNPFDVLLRIPESSLMDNYNINNYKSVVDNFTSRYLNLAAKKSGNVMLPRQKLENNPGNDRTVDTFELEGILLRKYRFNIVETDRLNTFSTQFDYIRSSRFIIVTDGSPFLVNSFLAKDSIIIALCDDLIDVQRHEMHKVQVILNSTNERNQTILVRKGDCGSYPIDLIEHLISGRCTIYGK